MRPALRFLEIPAEPGDESEQVSRSGKDKAYSIMWTQRLKRVFALEIGECKECAGRVKFIASIGDPEV